METFNATAAAIVAYRDGGMNQVAMVLGFDKRLTKAEVHEEARAAALRQFPIDQGWQNHLVDVAPFDAAQLAVQVRG